MNKPRIERRDVHGFILLDKPSGISSNKALQRAKWLLRARKAGHTGSLDPLASGLLPLAFGDATRLGSYLLGAAKTYEADVALGVRTSTGDAEGEQIAELPIPPFGAADWQAVMDGFVGESQQIPPMYSALKHQGERLYKLARQGEVVDRPARTIVIDQIELLEQGSDRIRFSVTCSKGTYVRTLAEDIADKAGTYGHLVGLRRTAAGSLSVADAVTLDQIEAAAADPSTLLQPLDCAVQHLPSLVLGDPEAARFTQGQRFRVEEFAEIGLCRIYRAGGNLLGLGRVEPNQLVRPEKVLAGQKLASK